MQPLLLDLQNHDLLGLDQTASAIIYAYPFTGQPTGHCVSINGNVLNALCAIDALGAADMYRTDTTITSACGLCRMPIKIGTTKQGTTMSYARPASAVVWYDLAYSVSDGPAPYELGKVTVSARQSSARA